MSTPTQLTAVLAASAVTAAIAYHLIRPRTAHRRAAIVNAAHAAHRDDVTGLDNRIGLHAALAGIAAQRRPGALILINVDGARRFVGRFGDRALAQLLAPAAGRLRRAASVAGGASFRLRRDEFAVILDDPAGAASVGAVAG